MKKPTLVECQEHGTGPWCKDWGPEWGHQPVRPVQEAIRDEVNLRTQRGRRLEYPVSNSDREEERDRAARAIHHVLSDWVPRVMELQGLAQTAERVRRAVQDNNQDYLLFFWRDVPEPPQAMTAALKAANIFFSNKTTPDREQTGQAASSREFIGREIGELAEEFQEAHQLAGKELDLNEELQVLLDKTSDVQSPTAGA